MTDRLDDAAVWRALRSARPAPPATPDSPHGPEAQALLAALLNGEPGPAARAPRRHLAGAVFTAAAVCLALGVGLVVVLVARHSPPRPVAAARPPIPLNGLYQGATTHSSVRPGTAQLIAAAQDPRGGLPWGLREIRTDHGQVCLSVGRESGGRIGALGIDGAWGDDGRFHPTPPQGRVGTLQSFCGDTDAAGHAFLNVTDLNAVASAAGDAARARSATPTVCASSNAHGRPTFTTVGHCPARTQRELAYGLLGPAAVSITYVGADGRPVTEPTSGPDGAYLIVLPHTRTLCTTAQHVHGYCDAYTSSFGPKLAAGFVTTVRYRDGRRCRLPRTPADGHVANASCPLVGYAAPHVPDATPRTVAAPVTATIPAIARPCGDTARDTSHCSSVRLRVAFTARLPAGAHSAYVGAIRMPPRDYTPGAATGCPGELQSELPDGARVHAGQMVHWDFDLGIPPRDCAGNVFQVTVAYVADTRLGLNGNVRFVPHVSFGRGAVIVGRTTARLPAR